MEYFEWECAVTEAVAAAIEVSYSDASGIVEAQPFVVQQCWGKGTAAEKTAAEVIEANQPSFVEQAPDAEFQHAGQRWSFNADEIAVFEVEDDCFHFAAYHRLPHPTIESITAYIDLNLIPSSSSHL